jgi:hypothetical protein
MVSVLMDADQERAELTEPVRVWLITTLREVEVELQRCWDAGQTHGHVRASAEEGLLKVRQAIGVLQQVKS